MGDLHSVFTRAFAHRPPPHSRHVFVNYALFFILDLLLQVAHDAPLFYKAMPFFSRVLIKRILPRAAATTSL